MRAHPRPPGFCRKIFGAKSANPRIGDFSPQIEENMIHDHDEPRSHHDPLESRAFLVDGGVLIEFWSIADDSLRPGQWPQQ